MKYEIEFFSGWHCGSGLSAGADVDALVIKDKNGLPFIPGKTIKGLLREAVEEYAAVTKCVDADKIKEVFGYFVDSNDLGKGSAFFTNAELANEEQNSIVRNHNKELLYKRLSATAIGENGIAKNHSLRRIEVVVPCKLYGYIHHVPEDFEDVIEKSLGLIKRLGSWRNRGLGRCTIKNIKEETLQPIADKGSVSKKLKFKCTLLSDVILNQRAASEGNQSTLDFIPGNNFLGIVAGDIYANHSDLALDILHSGNVRFGDAHPACDGIRSSRVPASYFYPKLGPKSECYVHHEIADFVKLKTKQLKQCRGTFVAFKDESFEEVQVQKTFAIKSAYDYSSRRSRDSQMFGYESLDKGQEFFFEIGISETLDSSKVELIVKILKESLIGKKHIGRSRTAQYGWVEIKECGFEEPKSSSQDGKYTTVYADSRLIFFDEYGMPTFTPTADQLFPKEFDSSGAKICWDKSQIRIFQYSPWNFKRQARDFDRCGIEKGSVFVLENVTQTPDESKYVGEYKNEGFGRVLYNPDFLRSKEGQNGLAAYVAKTACHDNSQQDLENDVELKSDLSEYLKRERKKRDDDALVYKLVNRFIHDNASLWKGERFASQWGTIRSIATKYRSRDEIIEELYGSEMAYLKHGVAKAKWDENGRIGTLRAFFEGDDVKEMKGDCFRHLVVNLASEMAKKLQGGFNND